MKNSRLYLLLANVVISLAASTYNNEFQSSPIKSTSIESGHRAVRDRVRRAPAPRPPHPRPHERHQPPIPSNDTLGQPWSLQNGQCEIGTNYSNRSNYTQSLNAQQLYVDFGLPARCTGSVVRWEFCYTLLSSSSGTTDDPNTISTVVLRRDRLVMGYRIVHVFDINIEADTSKRSGPSNGAGTDTQCDFVQVDSVDDVFIQHGDLIGFASSERVRLVFTSGVQSRVNGSILNVYNISTAQSNSGNTLISSQLQVGSLLSGNHFVPLNQSATPLLRAIINTTDINSTTNEPPTTAHSTTTPTSAQDNNCRNILTTPLFLSVVGALAAMMVLLLVLVFILSCCLCQVKCRHGKLRECCGVLYACCENRNRVIHRVKVEPLSMDQSMQYNELYVPSDPSQRRRTQRGNLHKNPAYSRNGSQDLVVAGVDEVDKAADSSVSEGTRALEHTYEMIDTLR